MRTFCGRNSAFIDGTLVAFFSPPKILSHLVQLLLFYILLRGFRELCFEDLDAVREERLWNEWEEQQAYQEQLRLFNEAHGKEHKQKGGANDESTVTLLLLLSASCALGQRYEDGNYINGEVYADYEDPAPQRPVHPTPRSYSSAPAQRTQPAQAKPAPVAILKQINRHNEDGSYTYGFEGADGSFKIETKQANGEVKGKYGFVDDSGKVRVVEYGADQYGFQPSGEGITVAPPTLVDETTSKEALEAQRLQEYQEYQQQALAAGRAPARAAPTAAPAPRQQAYQQQYVPQYETQQHTQAIYQPRPSPAKAAQAIAYAPEPRPQQLPQQLLQSQLIQQAQLYEAEPSAASAYRNGPVQFGPAPPQDARVQSQAVRPQPQARSGAGGGGILDQLARDYALPQNSAAPLHDISFGYY